MLITLEGLDGSGKTTAWEHLRDRYTEYCFTREPTHSWYGDAVSRSLNNDNADPLAELFLFMADHADHLHRRIIPALNQGKTVISDRYSDSRIAIRVPHLPRVVLRIPLSTSGHYIDHFRTLLISPSTFQLTQKQQPSERARQINSSELTTSDWLKRSMRDCFLLAPDV